jgi:hypothetical protein
VCRAEADQRLPCPVVTWSHDHVVTWFSGISGLKYFWLVVFLARCVGIVDPAVRTRTAEVGHAARPTRTARTRQARPTRTARTRQARPTRTACTREVRPTRTQAGERASIAESSSDGPQTADCGVKPSKATPSHRLGPRRAHDGQTHCSAAGQTHCSAAGQTHCSAAVGA